MKNYKYTNKGNWSIKNAKLGGLVYVTEGISKRNIKV